MDDESDSRGSHNWIWAGIAVGIPLLAVIGLEVAAMIAESRVDIDRCIEKTRQGRLPPATCVQQADSLAWIRSIPWKGGYVQDLQKRTRRIAATEKAIYTSTAKPSRTERRHSLSTLVDRKKDGRFHCTRELADPVDAVANAAVLGEPDSQTTPRDALLRLDHPCGGDETEVPALYPLRLAWRLGDRSMFQRWFNPFSDQIVRLLDDGDLSVSTLLRFGAAACLVGPTDSGLQILGRDVDYEPAEGLAVSLIEAACTTHDAITPDYRNITESEVDRRIKQRLAAIAAGLQWTDPTDAAQASRYREQIDALDTRPDAPKVAVLPELPRIAAETRLFAHGYLSLAELRDRLKPGDAITKVHFRQIFEDLDAHLASPKGLFDSSRTLSLYATAPTLVRAADRLSETADLRSAAPLRDYVAILRWHAAREYARLGRCQASLQQIDRLESLRGSENPAFLRRSVGPYRVCGSPEQAIRRLKRVLRTVESTDDTASVAAVGLQLQLAGSLAAAGRLDEAFRRIDALPRQLHGITEDCYDAPQCPVVRHLRWTAAAVAASTDRDPKATARSFKMDDEFGLTLQKLLELQGMPEEQRRTERRQNFRRYRPLSDGYVDAAISSAYALLAQTTPARTDASVWLDVMTAESSPAISGHSMHEAWARSRAAGWRGADAQAELWRKRSSSMADAVDPADYRSVVLWKFAQRYHPFVF